MDVKELTLLVDTVGRHVVALSQLALTGYVIRQIASGSFTYLNRRLEVLGKDAYVLYPTNQYEQTEDGRVVRTVPPVEMLHAEVKS